MSNVWITSHFLVTLCIRVTSSNSGSVGGPSAAAPSQSKLWISTGSSCQRSNMIGWYISQFSCFKSDHLLLWGNEQTDLKGQRGFILIWTLPSFLTSNSVLGTLFEFMGHYYPINPHTADKNLKNKNKLLHLVQKMFHLTNYILRLFSALRGVHFPTNFRVRNSFISQGNVCVTHLGSVSLSLWELPSAVVVSSSGGRDSSTSSDDSLSITLLSLPPPPAPGQEGIPGCKHNGTRRTNNMYIDSQIVMLF